MKLPKTKLTKTIQKALGAIAYIGVLAGAVLLLNSFGVAEAAIPVPSGTGLPEVVNVNTDSTEAAITSTVSIASTLLRDIMVAIGILFVIIVGYKLVVGGSEDEIKKSKTHMMYILIGLVLIVAANEIVQMFDEDTVQAIGENAKTKIGNITDWIRGAAAVIVTLFLIITGYKLVIGGSEEETKKAKTNLLYVVIGLVVIVVATEIVNIFDVTSVPQDSTFTKEIVNRLTGKIGDINILIRNLLIIVATLMLVISGARLATASGNEETVKAERAKIMAALVGLVIVVMASTVTGLFGGMLDNSRASECQEMQEIGGEYNENNFKMCVNEAIVKQLYEVEDGKVVGGMIPQLVNAITIVLAGVAVLMIIISGFKMVTASGNEDVVKNQKTSIMYSVAGLVVVMLAYQVVKLILYGDAIAMDASEVENLEELLSQKEELVTQLFNIMQFVQGFVAAVAVAVIIYAGIRLVTAGGNEDAVKKATTTIGYAVGGLVLISLASPIVATFYGRTLSDTGQIIGDGTPSAGIAISQMVGLTNFVLAFLGIIAMIMLIYGGVMYITGNEEGAKKAQGIMKNAVIGLIIIMCSYAIVATVVSKQSNPAVSYTNDRQIAMVNEINEWYNL